MTNGEERKITMTTYGSWITDKQTNKSGMQQLMSFIRMVIKDIIIG